MVNVTKLYPAQDATVFQAFGRVISGTCKYCMDIVVHASGNSYYTFLEYFILMCSCTHSNIISAIIVAYLEEKGL